MKGFSRFLVIGEQRIFREIGEVVKLAGEANVILVRMLKEPALDALTAENEGMARLEKRADEVAFRVRRDITDGAVNPTVLDNLLSCVDLADGMVDDFYYLSRELTRIARVEAEVGPRVKSLDSAFLTMLDLAERSFRKVLELLAEREMDGIKRERSEIELLEEKGDEVKDDALDELYRLAPGLGYLNFTHYSEVLHKIDHILDACEDLSDLAMAVITSISK